MVEYFQNRQSEGPQINPIQHLITGEPTRRRIFQSRSRIRNLGLVGIAAASIAASLVGVRFNLFPQQNQQSDSQPYATSTTEIKIPPTGNWKQIKNMTDLGVWVSSQLGVYPNTDSYSIPDFYPYAGPDSMKLQEIIELVNPGVNFATLKQGTPVEVPDRQTMIALIDEFHGIKTQASTAFLIPKGQTYDNAVSNAIRLQGSLQPDDPRIPIITQIEEITFGYRDRTQSTGKEYKMFSGDMVRQLLPLLTSLNQSNRRNIQ